jgi:hypothetical protein
MSRISCADIVNYFGIVESLRVKSDCRVKMVMEAVATGVGRAWREPLQLFDV